MKRAATAASALLECVRHRRPRSLLGWTLAATTVGCWLIILATIWSELAPIMADRSTLGSHDWDQMEAHRYLVKKTILVFHQFPFWNPFACGGHTTWGGFESGTIVISPWLPFYLAMTLPHAMRVEVWGSTFLAALGAWLLAGRFTRSPAARALVVVAFALNGRWTLQLAAGHTWHMVYGLMSWALYFFDRALAIDPTRGIGSKRDVVLCGCCLAAMVYSGGIYPLPQTIVVMAIYGTLLAFRTRSFRPVALPLVAGIISFGLSAPKLLPIFEVIARYPRLVDSPETIDLAAFVAVLTAKEQDMTSAHPGVTAWGWHEWGMYVGWAVVLAVFAGGIFGRGPRETPLKWVASFLLVLGFGAFDPHAPWPLLHHWVPIFRSQHVPSRWMYPALLLFLLVTASSIDRVLRRTGRGRFLAEIGLALAAAWVARDIATIARQPMTHAFSTKMPAVAESRGPFHNETHLPPGLAYSSDYAPPSLPAEIANIGTLDCGMFPGLNIYIHDKMGRTSGLGARGRDDPAYKGEVYIAEGTGEATITRWTPNEVRVAVRGALPGEHVVMNQNWDSGWKANGIPALDWSDQVGAELRGGGADGEIVFRYRPRTLWLGVILFLATAGGIVWAHRAVRKVRAAQRTHREVCASVL